jgi:hypothetical protein
LKDTPTYWKSCECGCGVEFRGSHRGGHDKRFASDHCRNRYHSKTHRRYIKNVRPRTARRHQGSEFQLGFDDLWFIDSIKADRGYSDRSHAMRVLLRWCRLRYSPRRVGDADTQTGVLPTTNLEREQSPADSGGDSLEVWHE